MRIKKKQPCEVEINPKLKEELKKLTGQNIIDWIFNSEDNYKNLRTAFKNFQEMGRGMDPIFESSVDRFVPKLPEEKRSEAIVTTGALAATGTGVGVGAGLLYAASGVLSGPVGPAFTVFLGMTAASATAARTAGNLAEHAHYKVFGTADVYNDVVALMSNFKNSAQIMQRIKGLSERSFNSTKAIINAVPHNHFDNTSLRPLGNLIKILQDNKIIVIDAAAEQLVAGRDIDAAAILKHGYELYEIYGELTNLYEDIVNEIEGIKNSAANICVAMTEEGRLVSDISLFVSNTKRAFDDWWGQPGADLSEIIYSLKNYLSFLDPIKKELEKIIESLPSMKPIREGFANGLTNNLRLSSEQIATAFANTIILKGEDAAREASLIFGAQAIKLINKHYIVPQITNNILPIAIGMASSLLLPGSGIAVAASSKEFIDRYKNNILNATGTKGAFDGAISKIGQTLDDLNRLSGGNLLVAATGAKAFSVYCAGLTFGGGAIVAGAATFSIVTHPSYVSRITHAHLVDLFKKDEGAAVHKIAELINNIVESLVKFSLQVKLHKKYNPLLLGAKNESKEMVGFRDKFNIAIEQELPKFVREIGRECSHKVALCVQDLLKAYGSLGMFKGHELKEDDIYSRVIDKKLTASAFQYVTCGVIKTSIGTFKFVQRGTQEIISQTNDLYKRYKTDNNYESMKDLMVVIENGSTKFNKGFLKQIEDNIDIYRLQRYLEEKPDSKLLLNLLKARGKNANKLIHILINNGYNTDRFIINLLKENSNNLDNFFNNLDIKSPILRRCRAICQSIVDRSKETGIEPYEVEFVQLYNKAIDKTKLAERKTFQEHVGERDLVRS